MATYDLASITGAVVINGTPYTPPGEQHPSRSEYLINVLAIGAGLLAGDTAQILIPVPKWATRVMVAKRTDTSNADVLQVNPRWPVAAPSAPTGMYLPPQSSGSTPLATSPSWVNPASGSVQMNLMAFGEAINVSLALVTSVPTYCYLNVVFYEE